MIIAAAVGAWTGVCAMVAFCGHPLILPFVVPEAATGAFFLGLVGAAILRQVLRRRRGPLDTLAVTLPLGALIGVANLAWVFRDAPGGFEGSLAPVAVTCGVVESMTLLLVTILVPPLGEA